MEISGKIIDVLPVQSGAGRNGTEWKKQEYVIETSDQYPKKCCFSLWGDKIDQCGIQLGQDLDVSFDIDCREWNGKWFNDIRAYKVVQRNVHNYERHTQQQPPTQKDSQPTPPTNMFENPPNDDLPF
ncbi:DUF3127 domain-containing protein [uncultured Bacteroides sp.]|uniref:DUF3127 domain-containing protein n=1 Tax=uncultured Bacteroides sp. TaxID=162156 RepID=UPI002AAB86AA|nr:DUF3127 domain-containing protein [uncultured Bacteroides sp.]